MFHELIKLLWGGRNPYIAFNAQRYRSDTQGWNSHHSFLADTIQSTRPAVVVEVGVWKGGSSIRMADAVKQHGINAVIIAVDTWLGSWEHWEQSEHFASLLFEHGYPSLYYTFLTNVVEAGHSDRIIPLPLDSANAAFVLSRKGIAPNVIHIDGGHDYDAVMSDLRRWWNLLSPGGVMLVDDYDEEGKIWPSVRDAVKDFLAQVTHIDFDASPYKCRFSKPL